MSFNDILAAVRAVTGNPREQATLLYACGAETGCRSINQIGGGPGRGPWQIETGPGGSSSGRFTDAQANNPRTAAQLFYRYWNVAGCTAQQGTLWVTDPHTAEYNAARCAEGGGSTAGNNIGAPYSTTQRATGAHFADMAMTTNTTNPGTATSPCVPGQDPNNFWCWPGGVGQTGVSPAALTPFAPLIGVASGIGNLAGALKGIASIVARIVDTFSTIDFWVSVLLVIGGLWLAITGAGNIVARGAAKVAAPVAKVAAPVAAAAA